MKRKRRSVRLHKYQKENLARIKNFRFIDDTFARRAFKGQRELVEFVLKELTGIDDIELDYYETQYDAISMTESRSFVLDIYGADKVGRKFDLEMEKKEATPERAEVHTAAMIAEHMKKNGKFSDLPSIYVIFVYEKDPVGDGRAVYEYSYRDNAVQVAAEKSKECGAASMKGRTHIIFVNGNYRDDQSIIGKLIHDLKCLRAEDMYFERLANRMREIKNNPKEVEHMCRVLDEVREEGREEGRKEGRKEEREVVDFYNMLIDQNRYEDLQKIRSDKRYFQMLLADYKGRKR